jgi:hypothetical protein
MSNYHLTLAHHSKTKVLEIVKESVTMGGGYSQAFHELTAPLDRMVIVIVLQCHRALLRCSVVLVEMESTPWQNYFCDIESQQKSKRRLFRATLELREIVLAAYKGRNEVLRAALSTHAYDALSRGLDEHASITKEASLRAFLENDWVVGFHDVEGEGSVVIPEQVSCGHVHQDRKQSTRGKQAIEEVASESAAIVKEYTFLLNSPFAHYCENQRKWAETDAVRDREYEGNLSVKRLSSKYRMDIVDSNKAMGATLLLAVQRLSSIAKLAHDPWEKGRHWMFTSCTDLLYRRMLLQPNYSFDDHAKASYELTLGKDRESIQREEEARLNEKARKEREMAESVIRAALVPYKADIDEDVDDEDTEKSDNEGFLGWDIKDGDDSLDQPTCKGGEDSNVHELPRGDDDVNLDHKSNEKDVDDSEWAQIESNDFDESNELDPFAWAKKFMWAEGERFVHSFESVLIVSIQHTTQGNLLLTSHSVYFHQIGDTIDVMTKEKVDIDKNRPAKQDRKWKLNRLTDIHARRYMLKAQALELFFANMEGKIKKLFGFFSFVTRSCRMLLCFVFAGLFLTFNGTKDRNMFNDKMRSNCKVQLFVSIMRTRRNRGLCQTKSLTLLHSHCFLL